MKVFTSFKVFLTILIILSLTSCEKEQERTVTEKEVPPAVLQAFNTAYPGATIKEYAEETEGGHLFYEVSCIFEGRKIDVSYKPDGTVAAIEEVIAAEQLPDVIHQAIAKEFQQFSIVLVEKIEEQGSHFFEVKLLDQKAQKKYELLFTEDGKLVEKEEFGEDEEE